MTEDEDDRCSGGGGGDKWEGRRKRKKKERKKKKRRAQAEERMELPNRRAHLSVRLFIRSPSMLQRPEQRSQRCTGHFRGSNLANAKGDPIGAQTRADLSIYLSIHTSMRVSS